MKLSDYIAEFLASQTDCAFVGNGGCVIHILDSLAKAPGMKVIPMENEQGAAIAAEAYSRVGGGRLGLAVATSGPGAINLLQGVACAFFDSIPTMFISGAPPVAHLKGDRKTRQIGFQEMDVVGIVAPITKYSVLLKDPSRVRYELEKLVHIAFEGRGGPVFLDLPDDIQRAEVEPEKLVGFVAQGKAADLPSQRDVDSFLRHLAGAERPLAIVGGGVKLAGARDAMLKFLRKTGIPFVPTWATIDLFDSSEGLCSAGAFGISSTRAGNFAVQTADLILNFASRLDTHEAGSKISSFAPRAKVVSIDIDPAELEKYDGPRFSLKMKGDVKPILETLNAARVETRDLTFWRKKIEALKARYHAYPPELEKRKAEPGFVNPYVFMSKLSMATGDDDIIVADTGSTLNWTMQAYAPHGAQSLFSAFNHSPMGYALPASIGAKFAAPHRRALCITGDGGLQMNIQELESVVFNKLPVKIFVMDNCEYAMIKQTQDTWMESRYVASDQSSGIGFPDISKVAKAYGMRVLTLDDETRLDELIREALDSSEAILCDVKIKSGEQIIPKLSFGRPLEDLSPLLPRDELDSAMKI